MAHLSYEEAKKAVIRGLIILGAITIIEVIIALLAKGHMIEGFHMNKLLYGFLMAVFSIIKALFILGEFMHLKYESKALRVGLALPFILILWAIIAFVHDGNSYLQRRLDSGNVIPVEMPPVPVLPAHETPAEHGEHVKK